VTFAAVHVQGAGTVARDLQCGKNAERLTIIDTDSLVASGITIQSPRQPIEAGASSF